MCLATMAYVLCNIFYSFLVLAVNFARFQILWSCMLLLLQLPILMYVPLMIIIFLCCEIHLSNAGSVQH